MLTQRPSRVNPFTRHDAGRLFVSASVLIIAVAAIFAVDIVPSGLGLKVGEVPKDDVVAPGTIQFTSEIQTQAARAAASAAVLPQYDYTTAQGADVADQQAAAFASDVAPVDAAFDASVTATQRVELLKSVLPDLTAASRTTLEGLTTASWKAVRDEAARVLDVIERPELRDSDVASVRAGLANRILGNLTADEKVLAAELIGPLLVPNSSFSQPLTDQARLAAAQGVRPVIVEIQQGEAIVDKGHPITPEQMEKVDAFNLNVPTLEQLVQLLALQIAVADDALRIQHERRRPAIHAIAGGQFAAAATVPPVGPGDVVAEADALNDLFLVVAIDAQERERPALHACHERPLVRQHRLAGRSPVRPEMHHYDLAAIVGQMRALAGRVLRVDVRHDLANVHAGDLRRRGRGGLARLRPLTAVEQHQSEDRAAWRRNGDAWFEPP